MQAMARWVGKLCRAAARWPRKEQEELGGKKEAGGQVSSNGGRICSWQGEVGVGPEVELAKTSQTLQGRKQSKRRAVELLRGWCVGGGNGGARGRVRGRAAFAQNRRL